MSFIDPMVTEDGAVIPPQDIVRKLRQVRPELGLRFVQMPLGPEWAVTYDWPDLDKRRLRVQSGEIPPDKAFDIVCFLPKDCPLESVPDYVRRACRDHPAEDIKKLLDDLDRYNEARYEEIWNEMLDDPDIDARNRIEVQGGALFDTPDGVLNLTTPKSRQGGFGDSPMQKKLSGEAPAP